MSNVDENFDFASLIKRFNEMYDLPRPERPEILPIERLEQFKDILEEEVREVNDIYNKYESYLKEGNGILTREQEIEILTDMSDWLGDIMVYVRSEAMRYGLPLENALEIIMNSNFSKLGEDGKPIYDERHKVMKGPDYWPPESKIKKLLERKSSD